MVFDQYYAHGTFTCLHSLRDELEFCYFFILYCRDESFPYFREKLPSISFKYYKEISPKKHYSHAKRFQ